jgi:hypothetical protein
MFLLLCAAAALIALQFTSGIGQWISANQQASHAVGKLQWLVAKIGLAPTLVTTRVLVVIFFVALYLLKVELPFWGPLIPATYYLYRTGYYLVIWHQFLAKAQEVVNDDSKTSATSIISSSSQSAATAGVDVSNIANS